MKINIGDIVKLKSGGPQMTVTGFGETMIDSRRSKIDEDYIKVVWMDKNGVEQRSHFDIKLLEIISDTVDVEIFNE